MWTIPDDFKVLCQTFHQGVDDVYSSTDEMIKDAVAKLNESQRAVVRAYLDELTSGKYNEEELWRLWYEAGARIRITTGIPGESARFLGMVKAEIDSSK
jgi:phosphoserine phosphatase